MAMGAPGGYANRVMVYPPEKGSFPLDHFAECQSFTDHYKQCLQQNDNMSAPCHHLAKDYLQCRMDKGLMAKEDLNSLGFAKPPVPTEKLSMDDERPQGEWSLGGLSTLSKMREVNTGTRVRYEYYDTKPLVLDEKQK